MVTGYDPQPALTRLLTAVVGIADIHGVFLSIERPGLQLLIASNCRLAIGPPRLNSRGTPTVRHPRAPES